MPFTWPGATSEYGNMPQSDRVPIRHLLKTFGDRLEPRLESVGLPAHSSPLFRPWSILVVKDSEKVLAAFVSMPGGGLPSAYWIDASDEIVTLPMIVEFAHSRLGFTGSTVVSLPLPDSENTEPMIEAAVVEQVASTERSVRLGALGDLTGVSHLEPYLRSFLDEHPDPSRNVFVMMRFMDSPQLNEIYPAIKETLAARGYHATRADDRDYTGELWTNIEVYLTCCHLGIAVFEDIEKREFNPNVALELGYMLARRRRCLILKEQHLPSLPADVINRLYKPFNMFDVANSIAREVACWVDVDLR